MVMVLITTTNDDDDDGDDDGNDDGCVVMWSNWNIAQHINEYLCILLLYTCTSTTVNRSIRRLK